MNEGRKTILVTLREMELGCLHMEERSREIRCFSSRFMAERWLKQNGFIFGRRSFFKYEGDYGEWIHLHDASWKYIDVEIEEYPVDDEAESQYKRFHPGKAPWAESGQNSEGE